jgi:dephospho-CoA kinase
VPIIALTGGIAAGKTTVANRFAELGAHVLSADELVRHSQRAGSPTLSAIKKRFGLGVVDERGELDRAALGRIVFEDEMARTDLEAIVHPAISAEFASRVETILAAQPSAIVIYDIPLLVESNRVGDFGAVIVLSCDPQIRHDRLVRLRGMSSDAAQSRIDAQASEQERLSIADWTIDSSQSIESTISQTDAVWADLTTAYRA